MSQSDDINYDKIVEETILKNNERFKSIATKRTIKQAYEEAHAEYDRLASYNAKLKAQCSINKISLRNNKNIRNDLIYTRMAFEKAMAHLNETNDDRSNVEQILNVYRNHALQLNEKFKRLDSSMSKEILLQKRKDALREMDEIKMLIQYTRENLNKVSEKSQKTDKNLPDVSQLLKLHQTIDDEIKNVFGEEKGSRLKLGELETSTNFLERAILESNAKYDIINTKLNLL